MRSDLKHTDLISLLGYDQESGDFVWKKNGKSAGTIKSGGGYRLVIINGYRYSASKLAWFYVNGVWPTRKLIFNNGNSHDCSIKNLSELPKGMFNHDHRSKARKAEYHAKYRAASPKPLANAQMKYRFGISVDEYVEKLKAQKGVCAICEQPETAVYRGTVRQLCVDHDHETNQIRSLLCHKCNAGLGHFRDSPDLLSQAAEYLRRYALSDNVVPLTKKVS